MQSDFSVFRDRLAEACHVRDTTPTRLATIIGMSPRRIIDLEHSGANALDIHRLGQIADQLDVSIDWLLGRSNVIRVMEMPELPEPQKAKRKKPA